MKYTAVIDGERHDVQLIRTGVRTIEAEIAGRRYVLDAEMVEPGVYWVQWNDRSIEIIVTPNGDDYSVAIDGLRTDIEVMDARAARRKATQHAQSGSVELRAPMPGKVVKVLVSEGTAVEANQGLVVIEAMKMQNEIKSPKQGIVRRLTVAGAVNAGDLLAVVE